MSTVAEAPDQRIAALAVANRIRQERAALKRDLHDGRITLEDILGAPHPAVVNTPLLDVLCWTRRGNRFQATGMAQLGRAAVDARINLLLPVGRASVTTRAWCVQIAQHNMRRPRGAS
jgi:hypothetical protein